MQIPNEQTNICLFHFFFHVCLFAYVFLFLMCEIVIISLSWDSYLNFGGKNHLDIAIEQ